MVNQLTLIDASVKWPRSANIASVPANMMIQTMRRKKKSLVIHGTAIKHAVYGES